MYSPQKKLGYTDVIYNVKTGKFYAPIAGDNYHELDVATGGGGSGTFQTTETLPLAHPTRVSSSNLKTQSDLNDFFLKQHDEDVESGKAIDSRLIVLENKGDFNVQNLPPLQ